MFKFLEKYIMGPMTKLSQLRLVRAITKAGMASIPFTIVGSMFLVLNILPLTIPSLQGIWDQTFFKVSSIYMLANKASMGLLALYFLLVTSYEYTKSFRDEDGIDVNPISGMLLSLFAFIMFIPQFEKGAGFNLLHDVENGIINGWGIGGDGVSRFAASGIFPAILVSWMVVNIYKMCIIKKLVVKMPEEVPEGVANSFTALIPAFIIALVVFAIQAVLVSFDTDLFSFIAIPFGFVTKLTNSLLGMVVIYFIMHSLWVVGIHGPVVLGAFLQPILIHNLALNQAGAKIPLALDFKNAYVSVGGSGFTLGLVIMCIFLAKSEQLKAIGKASIVPGLFNINEPVIFGMPVVYNPILAIPFVLVPIVTGVVAYLAITTGLVGPNIAQQPWPTPIFLSGIIGTGGDWRALVLQVVNLTISVVIWYPFFKMYDKKLVEEQKQHEKELNN